MSGLTENPKHEKVLLYIKSNPGVSKQDVVRGMEGDPSRITVLNILDLLEKDGLIVAKKDKPNSQIYRLYVNTEKPIIAAYKTLGDIKEISFSMLTKVIGSPQCKREMVNGKLGNMCAGILTNFQHLIHSLVFNVLLKWTKEIKDRDTLTRLYKIAYDNLLEIQMRFSESFKYDEVHGFLDDMLIKFDTSAALDKVEQKYQCSMIPIMMITVEAGLGSLKETKILAEIRESFECLGKVQF
jgi:hypothetical protein